MIVPKNPRRWDFCGCPPCPLCYDLVNPNGNGIGKWQARMIERVKALNFWREPAVVDGIDPSQAPEVIPMIVDMAEKTLGREPDDKELLELIGACEAIHVYNKSSKERRDAELTQAQEAALIKRAEDIERLKGDELLAGCVATRDKPEPAKVNTVLVDTMDRKKVEALCVTEDEKEAKKAVQQEAKVSEADRRFLQGQAIKEARARAGMGFPPGSLKNTAGMGKSQWISYDLARAEAQMQESQRMANFYPPTRPLTAKEAIRSGMSFEDFVAEKRKDPSRYRK